MKKRIISLLVVMVLVLTGTNITVFAAEKSRVGLSEEEIQVCMQIIHDDTEGFNITKEQIKQLYIGNPIYTYTYFATGELECNDFKLYPIFLDFKIVLLVLKSNDGSIQVTKGLVNELNSFQGKDVAIIYDSEKCYVWNKSDKEVNVIGHFQETFENRGSWVQYDNTEELHANKLNSNQKLNIELEESSISRGSESAIVTLSVPVVRQGSYTNLCWAASVKSIGQYLTGRSVSIETIAQTWYPADDFNHGTSIAYAIEALDYRYSVDYTVRSSTSETTIYGNLSSGYPVYSDWSSSAGNHANVIRGINRNSSTLYIMDPQCGNTSASKTSGVYKYTSPYSGRLYSLNKIASYE